MTETMSMGRSDFISCCVRVRKWVPIEGVSGFYLDRREATLDAKGSRVLISHFLVLLRFVFKHRLPCCHVCCRASVHLKNFNLLFVITLGQIISWTPWGNLGVKSSSFRVHDARVRVVGRRVAMRVEKSSAKMRSDSSSPFQKLCGSYRDRRLSR